MVQIRQRRSWTWRSGAPRVVLECAPPDSPDIIADIVRREGYEVAICTRPGRGHHCDLLTHGACALVDEADVVVNLLGNRMGHEIGMKVLSARRPAALVIGVGSASDSRPDGVPGPGSVTIDKRVSRTHLLSAIREALARGRGTPPIWGDGCS